MPVLDPDAQRRFAYDAVHRLRAAGYEAYLAGGCVRDQLLGLRPKDFDVATNALPKQIRELFGWKRTLAIGAAFGVISVLGPKAAGMVEVTTFRQDAGYSDGRHPDQVTFTSAEEDAKRRDFTINGLFYDPLRECVIDFVGGQEDLRRGLIRAIGCPLERFTEDKLRMLRAIRFAAAFEFALDPETFAAIQRMADEVAVVSPERIAMEMRRMLTERGRVRAVQLLRESGLDRVVLPEIAGVEGQRAARLERSIEALGRLAKPGVSLVLATLLHELVDEEGMLALGKRWRLSNKEIDPACWLVKHHSTIRDAATMPWSVLQPILIAPDAEDLLALLEAAKPESAADVAFCRAKLALPREVLDPPPLVTGADLIAQGMPCGPTFGESLTRLRSLQLDGRLTSKAEALALVTRWLSEDKIE